MLFVLVVVVLMSSLRLFHRAAGACTCRPNDDVINGTELATDFRTNFSQFSGYLNGSHAPRHMFYWFIESQRDHQQDPLIVWLHGGSSYRSCSALVALLSENGPFRRIDSQNSSISENVFAWNKVANVLYLEVPIEVGFSYTTTYATPKNDSAVNDIQRALIHFLKRFPEFQERDVYLGGQGYGSYLVLRSMQSLATDRHNFPNPMGVILYNAAWHTDAFVRARYLTYYYRGRIPESTWDKVRACCGQHIETCVFHRQCPEDVNDELERIARRPPSKRCYSDDDTALDNSESNASSQKACPQGSDTSANMELAIETLLNNATVKKAIHVDSNHAKQWSGCSASSELAFNRQFDIVPVLHALFAAGVRLLLFYGDGELENPYVGAAAFVQSLNRTRFAHTAPWHYLPEVPSEAGLVTRYDKIDLLSIKGSGQYSNKNSYNRPREILQIVANFLRRSDNYSHPDGANTTRQPSITHNSAVTHDMAVESMGIWLATMYLSVCTPWAFS